MRAVGAEGHRLDLVAGALEGAEVLLAGHVPEADGLVVAARGQRLAVLAEGDAVDRPAVALKAAGARWRSSKSWKRMTLSAPQVTTYLLSGLKRTPLRLPLATSKAGLDVAVGRVPDADAVVAAADRGEQLAVGAEGDGGNHAAVADEVVLRLAGLHVEDADVLVAAAADQQLAVGAEGDGVDGFGVAGEGARPPCRCRRPRGGCVLSPPALATCLPSGLKATERTASAWPVKQSSSRPVCVSQILTVPSWLPLAILRAVGAVGQGQDPVTVAQLAVAEDAADVGGQAGRQGGHLPAGAGERLARLAESAGGQGRLALLGEGVGAGEPVRGELLGQAVLVGVGALLGVLAL